MRCLLKVCLKYHLLFEVFLSILSVTSALIFDQKKNGAARLDPWEIFVLLALKIPFHFTSLRKLPSILYVNCL